MFLSSLDSCYHHTCVLFVVLPKLPRAILASLRILFPLGLYIFLTVLIEPHRLCFHRFVMLNGFILLLEYATITIQQLRVFYCVEVYS